MRALTALTHHSLSLCPRRGPQHRVSRPCRRCLLYKSTKELAGLGLGCVVTTQQAPRSRTPPLVCPSSIQVCCLLDPAIFLFRATFPMGIQIGRVFREISIAHSHGVDRAEGSYGTKCSDWRSSLLVSDPGFRARKLCSTTEHLQSTKIRGTVEFSG